MLAAILFMRSSSRSKANASGCNAPPHALWDGLSVEPAQFDFFIYYEMRQVRPEPGPTSNELSRVVKTLETKNDVVIGGNR